MSGWHCQCGRCRNSRLGLRTLGRAALLGAVVAALLGLLL